MAHAGFGPQAGRAGLRHSVFDLAGAAASAAHPGLERLNPSRLLAIRLLDDLPNAAPIFRRLAVARRDSDDVFAVVLLDVGDREISAEIYEQRERRFVVPT